MKKVAVIVGARPQFIKHAYFTNLIQKKYNEVLINTGQHYDKLLSDVFFTDLAIPEPDYNLEVASTGDPERDLPDMMLRLRSVFRNDIPDYVVVYGDTTSSLAGALTASKMNIPLVHVESGLRSYDKSMPEEINRIVIDHIAKYHYCPTEYAATNLMKENIDIKNVKILDVMKESIKINKQKAWENSTIVEDLSLTKNEYILATFHRQSNTDNEKNLKNIVDAICDINYDIVIPIHPRTKHYLDKYNLYNRLEDETLIIEPVGYIDMLNLLLNSKFVMTDSGGVQNEADAVNKYCITLRDNTEWIDTLNNKNKLVGANYDNIIRESNKLLGWLI